MKRALISASVLLLAVPGAATGREAGLGVSSKGVPATVLALEGDRRGDSVVRLRGQSLRRISKRVALAGRASMWALAPDRSRIAIVVDSAKLRIVDTRRLRILRTARTPGGEISNIAWLGGGRIVGLDNGGAFVVDAVTGRLVRSVTLPGLPYGSKRVGSSIVTVLAPRDGLGTAILASINDDGRVRTVALDRIKVGAAHPDPTDGLEGEFWRPGLAVDGNKWRAFVVGATEIAEVDLATMTAQYWTPSTHGSLLGRLHDWVEPAAAAKGPMAGSYRSAVAINGAHLAITGWDARPRAGGGVDATPAGLSILDVDDRSMRVLDSSASQVVNADGMLLATTSWPIERQIGLIGFSPEGNRRYGLFAGRQVGIWGTFGSRVFAYVPRVLKHIHVVDAFSGRVLGKRFEAPRLLDRDWIDY